MKTTKSIDDIINEICIPILNDETFKNTNSGSWNLSSAIKTGKTTRCVDEAIQILFTKKELKICFSEKEGDVIDPAFPDSSKAQIYFVSCLMRRLYSEHHGQYTTLKSSGNIRIILNKKT